MRCRPFAIHLVVVCLLLGSWEVPQAQTPPAALSTPASSTPTEPVQPEAVAARKTAVEKQLKSLDESKRPEEDLQAERAQLDAFLKVLTALEQALQKRATYVANLEALPQRLHELEAELQTLEARPPRDFPQVTESLRDEYQSRLQAIQEEMQQRTKQTALGEMRLAAIPEELEQRAGERAQLEKALLGAQAKTAKTEEQKPVADVEMLEWELRLRRADIEALQAERAWLTKRGPLQDALGRVVQTRLKALQRDLDTIQQALGTAIRQEQLSLSGIAADLKRQLEQVTDPAEALVLRVRLETLEMQQATSTYRQELNRLKNDLQAQDKRSTRLQQAADRLTSLVEKYTSGEGIAQRLFVAFEHLQRGRQRYSDAPLRLIEERLQDLTVQAFAVDDRLFEFNRQAETRLAEATATLQALPPQQRQAEVVSLRKMLNEQHAALREQQQVLAGLIQDHTTLLAAYRTYKRLLDETYHFVLTKMFWIRDGRGLRRDVVSDMAAGTLETFRRLQGLAREAWTRPRTGLAGAGALGLMALMLGVLPWGVMWVRRRLRHRLLASLAAPAVQDTPREVSSAILLVVQAAVWPAYLTLIAGLLGSILPQDAQHRELSLALVHALLIGALILGVSLVGRALFQPDGWVQRASACGPELCRFLRRLVLSGGVATLVFLMPWYVLLAAPGTGEVAIRSIALAYACFLGFQGVVLVLLGLAGWRSSPLMDTMLARSRQHDGLWWRFWPVVYVLVLGGMTAIIGLDVLGYRYAARTLWVRALESLFVVLLFRILLVLLVLRLVHGLLGSIFRDGSRLRRRFTESAETIERAFQAVYSLGSILLALLAVALILEIWGVSIFQFLTSPLGTRVLTRFLLITLTIGLTVAVIRISSAVTDYLAQPRTTRPGSTREASRKLKTLAPLAHTLLKVGIVFVAALVILELMGIATGPFLAGLGIAGLAVGFASQSLIKDVINGLFILFEDSLNVGDVAILRGTGGLVEKVTLRAVTIRGLDGTVHVIPNSTLDMVSNMTKVFSYYLLDVRVAYREDVDTVMGLLREIDDSMRQDPDYRYDMLEPLDIWGVERFDESAVIVRARLKTRPIQQWRIGREFNRRMKKVFDEHGIRMPFPHRTIYWGTPQDEAQVALQRALEAQQLVRDDD